MRKTTVNTTLTGSDAQKQCRIVQRIPIERIRDARFRLRPTDESVIDGLLLSIKKYGLLQPIMVTSQGDHFEVIFGKHRLEACRRLGSKEIPAFVEQASEHESFILQVVENIQRNVRINPVEEARGYQMLMRHGMTIQEIGSRIGKSYQYVWSRLRLLDRLHPKILEAIEKGRYRRLTTSHAEQLSMLNDTAKQLDLAEAIEDYNISVASLERVVYQELRNERGKHSPGKTARQFQVIAKGHSIYEHSAGGVNRIVLMSDTTLNTIARHLGKKARRVGRIAGRMRRETVLENADQTIPKLKFLAAFFNETFGWGKLSLTSSEVIIEDSILNEAGFLNGYIEGFLGMKLDLVSNANPKIFKIVDKSSPRGEHELSGMQPLANT